MKTESVSLSVMFDPLWPHGLLLARLFCPWNFPGRILEWVGISFSRESSRPRDQTWVSCTTGWFFTVWDINKYICTCILQVRINTLYIVHVLMWYICTHIPYICIMLVYIYYHFWELKTQNPQKFQRACHSRQDLLKPRPKNFRRSQPDDICEVFCICMNVCVCVWVCVCQFLCFWNVMSS